VRFENVTWGEGLAENVRIPSYREVSKAAQRKGATEKGPKNSTIN